MHPVVHVLAVLVWPHAPCHNSSSSTGTPVTPVHQPAECASAADDNLAVCTAPQLFLRQPGILKSGRLAADRLGRCCMAGAVGGAAQSKARMLQSCQCKQDVKAHRSVSALTRCPTGLRQQAAAAAQVGPIAAILLNFAANDSTSALHVQPAVSASATASRLPGTSRKRQCTACLLLQLQGEGSQLLRACSPGQASAVSEQTFSREDIREKEATAKLPYQQQALSANTQSCLQSCQDSCREGARKHWIGCPDLIQRRRDTGKC
jgi:hypothetical protein